MPAVNESKYRVCPGISGRKVQERPCIKCGGPRDAQAAYTTNQGKRSVRTQPRCRACQTALRKSFHDRDRPRSRAASRAWRNENAERRAAYSRARQKDPAVRAMKARHQRLRKARMRSSQSDTPAIRVIYALAMQEEALIQNCPVFDLPELGKKLHVDHVIPLNGANVCGLHAPQNLQIIPIGINMRKGARCPL